jgi:Na+/H+ antiporter NhaC
MFFRSPGAAIYGTITVGALLAAESAVSETYAETIAAVIITLLVYWLAHAYSDFTEYRLAHHQPLKLGSLTHTLRRQATIMVGALVPLCVLLGCWIATVPLTDAVNAAILTSAAMIVLIELTAGIRAQLSGRELAAQAAMGTLFGVLVITLRLVLH